MKWLIVVAMLNTSPSQHTDMYAFVGYPFPNPTTCTAFVEVNEFLIVNIARSHYDGQPVDQIYCAPAESVFEHIKELQKGVEA
jgi:hypothetical protein